MTDKLIEAVARAMYESKWADWELMASGSQDKWRSDARAAIAAIEASGTHVVVPVEPTETMLGNGEFYRSHEGYSMAAAYAAMLAVRPKVLP